MVIRNHFDNKKDNRYTVTREFCGKSSSRYVARFCGKWIEQADNKTEAWEIAQEHYDNHKIDGATHL